MAARPEHVLVQTALTPTLSQWVPALIHPHVTLGPCTPRRVQSLKLSEDSDGEPSRHVPSPRHVRSRLNASSGLKDTLLKAAALVLPCVFAGSGVSATLQRLWPAAPGTAKLYRDLTKKKCSQASEERTNEARAMAIPLGSTMGVRGLYVRVGDLVQVVDEPVTIKQSAASIRNRSPDTTRNHKTSSYLEKEPQSRYLQP